MAKKQKKMNPEEFASEDARKMVEYKLNSMTTNYGTSPFRLQKTQKRYIIIWFCY